ncbi:uncharacterized protein LOC119601054 isoform X1 [Lucilia sericata]|uniref:uncharacterized protein LOC119601054 isoform X1 n=1 Tax=Lucilia sericata TaxID=13632 RepID=UPI0018A80912|nr:uncharacterized protein LOC119601054 isoform X1 [Lucilia sericata]
MFIFISKLLFFREKPKKLQTQQRQFEILVDFMEQHSDLAKGQLQCGNAKQRANNLWTKLADDLNSNGPPVRDVAGWKKVWSDLKTHTKVKMRKNKISISSTGGGVSQYCPLSSMEEQIINLLQMEEAVNGRATSTYFGTSSNVSHDVSANKEPAEEVLLSSQNENYSLSESAPADKRSCLDDSFKTAKRSRLSKQNDRDILLKTQVENQGIFHNESTKVLGDVRDSLKELVRYNRKKVELKERKLTFCKKKFEFKKEYKLQKQKTQIEKLELKKKILELEIGKPM